MKELSLHLLDLAENSVSANAHRITICVEERLPDDRLLLEIYDDGVGMSPEMLAVVQDPFITSRTTRRVGLGIPLLKAAAEMCEGTFEIDSTPGAGTRVRTSFQHSHIDRMPVGDLAGTFMTLLISHPEVNWRFVYSKTTAAGFPPLCFDFDDLLVKQTLDEIPLTEPAVLTYLSTLIKSGVQNVASGRAELLLN